MLYPTRSATRLAAALVLATAAAAHAQGHGGGGHGGGPGGSMGNGMHRMGEDNRPDGPPPPDSGHPGGPISTMRGGLQVGPPGRWWDDKHFAHDLGLTPEQQKRMDAIFNENRPTLTTHFQALQEEEGRMEVMSRSTAPDEAVLFAQIDRIAQARASLEKSLTHYLLGIRREMSADQVTRLDSHR